MKQAPCSLSPITAREALELPAGLSEKKRRTSMRIEALCPVPVSKTVVGRLSFCLRLHPICNCVNPVFLKITCNCLARERTAVSVRFIRIPIALELRPVGANFRSLSSSAWVHGRESKSAGSVIGPSAPRIKAKSSSFRSCRDHFILESNRCTRESRPLGSGN
jgi:hypothetical protein